MTEPQTASGLMDQIHMLRLAKSQYEDTLVAVHVALDDTLGRDHRADDSAAASIRRLAAEAEQRGAVKALRIEAMRGLEAVEKARQRPDGLFRDFATHLMKGLSDELARRADAIESGDVTL